MRKHREAMGVLAYACDRYREGFRAFETASTKATMAQRRLGAEMVRPVFEFMAGR